MGNIEKIGIEKIDVPERMARMEIEKGPVEELSRSIRERGQLQAIEVTKKGDRYEVVFGHRRYLAVKELGWGEINAIVVEKSEKDVLLDRAVENLQRVDLTPVEEAIQYGDLKERLGMSHEEIGKMTGKSAGSVKRSIEILRMTKSMQAALHAKLINKGVAEELVGCKDEAHREYLLEMAVEHGITVAIARKWVEDWKKSLRAIEGDVERGGGLEFINNEEPTYVTCFFCKKGIEVREIEYLKACKDCRREIAVMLSK